MNPANETPTFNLKVVLRETGLKADTLRAWERRHGLPRPARTAGGHRLYLQRDIDTIKWLRARQEEGLRISQAVDLWRSLEAGGYDPLQVEDFTTPGAKVSKVQLPKGNSIAELRRAWVSACARFDEWKAEEVFAQAFALYPVESVCLEILQKGLVELGDAWYQNELTVQQEHFASGLAMRRLETLVASTPFPSRPERILIGCPPQEEHTFSALLLNLLLRRQGWEALHMGANVPLAQLEEALSATEPQLVILAAQQLHTAANMIAIGRLLQEKGIPLGFGGRVFNLMPELRERIPGYFLGESLQRALPMVQQILSASPPLAPVESPSPAYREALTHYRRRQALIEANMWQTMKNVGIQPRHLNIANLHFVRDLTAALALGDMDFLRADLDWLKGMLSNYLVPDNLLSQYLTAFYRAAETHLDERGAPLVTYLAQLAGE
jgi:DNA-binding transcriptional MerR regulator